MRAARACVCVIGTEDFVVQGKQRLVTLSAKKNAIEEIPRELGKLQLLAEIFFSDNKIGRGVYSHHNHAP